MMYKPGPYELVDRDLDINRPYLFECEGKSKTLLVFLVRVTGKGFNFFVPEKEVLLFSDHFYDRRYGGKRLPEYMDSLKTSMIWDHSVRIKPLEPKQTYWPDDVVWRPYFEGGFCCVEVTKTQYDNREVGDRYTCQSAKKKTIYPIGIVRDKCKTERGNYYFLIQFGSTPVGNVYYRKKYDPNQPKRV